MTRRQFGISILAAAVLLAAGTYELGLRQGEAGLTKAGTAQAPATAKRILYWHDPMVPSQHFDKPGKSPFMDMDLVPVYAPTTSTSTTADAADTVVIDPHAQQSLGMRTAPVVEGRLDAALMVVGNVAYDERELAVVQARANGFVEHLYVHAPLEHVKAGQALADMLLPDWVAVQEEYLSVRKFTGTDAQVLLAGARQRLQLAGMSEPQIRQLERSGKTQAHMTVTAPVAGVISELGIREGMTVTPGLTLFRLNGLATVWVNAEVPESQAALVRPGLHVEATAPARPDQVFRGQVSALLPDVDAATRTLKARIVLANPAETLAPGMSVNISLASAETNKVLLVPSEALIRTGTRTLVYIAQDGGGYSPVEVLTGREGHGQTEIRQGLEAGQRVIVSGQFLLDSEASLKGIGQPAARATPDRSNEAAVPDGMAGKMDMRGMGQ